MAHLKVISSEIVRRAAGAVPNAFEIFQVTVQGMAQAGTSSNLLFAYPDRGGVNPVAAWIGNFTGVNFAELNWSIQDLATAAPDSLRLWVVNGSAIDRNVDCILNIILMY